jgi:hypothetical protein
MPRHADRSFKRRWPVSLIVFDLTMVGQILIRKPLEAATCTELAA